MKSILMFFFIVEYQQIFLCVQNKTKAIKSVECHAVLQHVEIGLMIENTRIDTHKLNNICLQVRMML